MKNSFLLLSFGIASNLAIGQITNSEVLDHNNAAALISDEGLFFNYGSQNAPAYEIPSGSGVNSIYAMSPWVAALDGNGQLHFSGNSYNATNFHSGPIADQMHYGTAAYDNQYQNAVWSVTSAEIQSHIANLGTIGYVTPSSILNWPGNGDVSIGVADQLAPYVDLDNDGVYEPLDGEYPEIRGGKATLVIMNDESFQPTGMELGVELHIMFYQISAGSYLDNTTFMHVETFNRSMVSYADYRQTFYVDYDLGNFADDYIGCDTTSNLGYVYNGDNNDESSGVSPGYGIDPPCQGLTVLSHDMSAFGYYSASGAYPYTDPNTPLTHWNHMNAMFSDGTPWVFGGLGYAGSNGATTTPTNYMFSGNPSDTSSLAWSEQNTDGNLASNPPGDRRVTLTIGEDVFLPGTSICSEYAWVYDRSGDRLENVNNVINISNSLKTWYDLADGEFMCNSPQTASIVDNEVIEFAMYPNPSNGHVTIDLPQTEQEINIQIVDVSGRVLINENYYNTSTIQLNLSGATGLYLVKTSIGNHSAIQRLVCN